jgi:hypothetical protein
MTRIRGGFSAGATTGDGGANYSTHRNTSGKNTGGVAPMLGQDDNGNDSAITRSGVNAGTVSVTMPPKEVRYSPRRSMRPQAK